MIGTLTRKQAAIVGAYTGFLCGPFEDMHKFIEQIMDRPVFTHELASKALSEEIREKAKPFFLALCVDRDAPAPENFQ